jgi:hypothetical protein
MRLVEPQGQCGGERKISTTSGLDPRTVRERGQVLTGFWWEHLREGDQLEDPGIVLMIIFRWLFRRWDVVHGLV